MKKITFVLCLLVAIFSNGQKINNIELNDGWQFSQNGKNEWQEAQVPGSVQQDLIRYNILPDPYFGTNENLVQWPENESGISEKHSI